MVVIAGDWQRVHTASTTSSISVDRPEHVDYVEALLLLLRWNRLVWGGLVHHWYISIHALHVAA